MTLAELLGKLLGLALIFPAFCFLWTAVHIASAGESEWKHFKETGRWE
jgi:hypothetical protein